MQELDFGFDSKISLPDSIELVDYSNEHENFDVERELIAALRDPIEYPGLQQMTIPEDKVAIILEDGIPNVDGVVAGLLAELLTCNIAPEDICIVESSDGSFQQIGKRSKSLVRDLEIVQHDSTNRDALGYIGPSKHDDAVYVNRKIADADVVIPIGVIKQQETSGYLGPNGCLIQFVDHETQQRFYRPASYYSSKEREKRIDELNEIARLLGTRMTIQVVPGGGEKIQRFFVGDTQFVQKQAREHFESIWRSKVPHRASLVIAAMTGGPQQQTWNNFARILQVATEVVESDGAIAVCSKLKSKPGIALKKVAGADDLDKATRLVEKEKTSDAIPAAQLLRTLETSRVYLLSELDEEQVEGLGMAYVSNPDEIVRLVSRHESCIAIGNAHIAKVELADEDEE